MPTLITGAMGTAQCIREPATRFTHNPGRISSASVSAIIGSTDSQVIAGSFLFPSG